MITDGNRRNRPTAPDSAVVRNRLSFNESHVASSLQCSRSFDSDTRRNT